MAPLTILEVINYGLVLIYGLFLSTNIAGGWENRKQRNLIAVLCPVLLLVQGICWLLLGVGNVRQIYPLIVHLPLVLVLIFVLKKPVGVALVSVFTAYLCCQLPRWVSLVVTALCHSPLIGEISYTLVICPILFLLRRYFARTAHQAMTYSRRLLFLFGSLPFVYYLFDYATVVYSDALYGGIPALTEFFPTALIVFYVMFLTAYHAQTQKRTQAELQKNMLEAELKRSGIRIETLQRVETQAAIYQHDMRHHLTIVKGFLSSGTPQQAEEYIKKVQADVEAITPKRFCENETINLLCSSFAGKAERMGIRLSVTAKLPQALFISDTELCSILSNGLENALHAVSAAEMPDKWVEFYCGIRLNKFLIEIKNPYCGEVIIQNGLPVSSREGHGYGCRSIRVITEQHKGICMFETEDKIFILRVVLPMPGET